MIPLIAKTLHDKRWVLLAWVLGMTALVALTIAFYPSFSESSAFDQLAKSLPPQFQSLIGDADAYKKLPNYISQQLFAFRIPLFTFILAVVMAINLTSTEEENGTLKTLQSLPISRAKVVFAKWISLGVLTAIVCTAALPAVLVGVALIGETIDVGPLVSATFLLWLLTFAMASFTMMLGLGLGRKSLAVGMASLFAFYNIFMSTLAPAVSELREIYKISLYYYYDNPKLMLSPFDWSHVGVLVVVTLAFGLVGLVVYQRRDIQNA